MTSIKDGSDLVSIDKSSVQEVISFVITITAKDNVGAFLSSTGLFLLIVSGWLVFRLSKTEPGNIKTWNYILVAVPGAFGLLFTTIGPAISYLTYGSSVVKNAITVAENQTDRANQEAARARRIDANFVRLSDSLKNPLGPSGILKRLETNQDVQWLVRIIPYRPYDPKEEATLPLHKLSYFGGPEQLYTFVSDYEELRGLTAAEAAKKAGLKYKRGYRISVIIFPLFDPRVIYPVNARGLMQIIDEVEKKTTATEFFSPKDRLGTSIHGSLLNTRRPSWEFASYKLHYRQFCEEALKFACDKDRTYAARKLIGDVSHDWHPLGFAQPESHAEDPCQDGTTKDRYCKITSWPTEKDLLPSVVGSRVFMTENAPISTLRGRIMIDFDEPETQRIPLIPIDRPVNNSASE